MRSLLCVTAVISYMPIVDVPDEWRVEREADALLKELGDLFLVSHRTANLEGEIHVVGGSGDTVHVRAEIASDDGETLETLWLSSEDFGGDVETVRNEVIDEFEHWLSQYREY